MTLRELRPPVADLAIGGLLLAFGVLEELTGSSRVTAHYPLQFAILLVVVLPVVWRRRWPAAGLLVCAVAFGGKALVMEPMSQPLAEPLALGVLVYTVGARLRLRPSLALLVAAMAISSVREIGTTGDGLGGAIINQGFTVMVWAVGRLVRTLESRATVSEGRVAAVEQWAAESSREAVADERLRIARELHDIVAHSIGVVLLHAGGGRRMLDHDVEQSRAAFETIERAAGDALAETRRLLDVLRTDHDQLSRQPTVDDVPELVDRVRAAGVDVHLDLEPVGDLSPGLSLCLYRIVQEATTNAVRHGRAGHIGVRVHDGGDAVEVDVVDDGTLPATPSQGGGHGIAGMRERVALFGGTLRLGPRPDGGFEVAARLPRELA